MDEEKFESKGIKGRGGFSNFCRVSLDVFESNVFSDPEAKAFVVSLDDASLGRKDPSETRVKSHFILLTSGAWFRHPDGLGVFGGAESAGESPELDNDSNSFFMFVILVLVVFTSFCALALTSDNNEGRLDILLSFSLTYKNLELPLERPIGVNDGPGSLDLDDKDPWLVPPVP